MMNWLLFLSMTMMCYSGTCLASDNMQYTILPYDDMRDHDEVFAIIVHNIKKLCTEPDGKPIKPMNQEAYTKLHEKLKKGKHSSPLIKPVEGTYSRIVLRNQQHLVGIADFFQNATEFDAIKQHDGYAEILLTDEEHTAQYSLLIAGMLSKCQEIGLKRLLHHLVNINNALHELPEYKSIIAAGFVMQDQTEFEKKHNAVRFEKTL